MKKATRETITFTELRRLSFCNSSKLTTAVEINGERHQWVGFGFVNEGELHGDEILVVEDIPTSTKVRNRKRKLST